MRHCDKTETFILLQRSPPPSNCTMEKRVLLFHDIRLKIHDPSVQKLSTLALIAQRKLSSWKTKLFWRKDEVVLPCERKLNRMINIYKVAKLLVFTFLKLFTSRPEKVESGTWEKITQLTFQNASQNSRNYAKFIGKQLC